MDPVPFTPPEVILNYGEEQSGSLPLYHFPPRYHRPFPAELNTSSNETSSCEARTDGSASQKPATVAEMLRSTAANSDHRTSQTQAASNQTPMGPVQHQGSPSFLHFLPGVSPSPLSLQDFSPDPPQMGLSPLLPELVFTPCSPQDPLWLNMNPLSVTPDSRFGVSPCVLVPVSTPTEPWFSPDSPARFRLPQPQFCPSWCVCPESVPVHQPCTPGLLPSRAESTASGREQSAEQCKSGGQRSKICREEEKEHREETSTEEKLREDDSVNNTTKSETSLTFLDPLDEELLANHAFEDYMSIMDALSPEIQENVDAKAHETEEERDVEEEKLEIENGSFLEYLDELCKDEDFVKRVGLILDTEYLDSLLSSSLAPIDLLALEEQEQVASTLNIEEHTDSFLSSDHSEAINFIPLKEQEEETLEEVLQEQSLQPALCCSPLLPSHLLEETPGSQENDSFPLPEEHCSPLRHSGSLFMDCSFTSSLLSPAKTSPDTSPTSELTAGDSDALVAAPAATLPAADGGQDESKDVLVSLKNLSNNLLAQLSQKLQDGSLSGDHLASKSPSSCRVSGSLEDPRQDPALSFRADSLTDSPPQSPEPPSLRFLALKTLNLLPPPPAQIREAEEHHSPSNPKSFSTPPKESDDTNYAIPVPASLSFVEDSRDPQAGGDISGSVPEKQTVEPPERLQVPQESATPGVFSELRTGARRETETKCQRDPEKGVRTSVTRKPNKEKRMIKKTFEKKKEKKETKLIRRSQRQSGQRLFVEYKTETAEEKKPSEKNIKKTAQSTPEKDEVIYEKQRRYSGEKQLCKKEESQGTNVINSEQSGETADEKQGQKLAGDQREANSSDVCAETGEQNALLTKTQQDKTGKGRVNREEEAVRMSCIVRRRTRSMATEEKVQLSPVLSPSTRARQKNKHSETQRSETKSSPKRGKQVEPEGNEQENVSEPQALPVSSPKKRSRGRSDEEEKSETADETQSSGCEAEEEVSPSPPSPRVQTQSAQDSKDDQGSLEESPGETLLNEINEPLSAKTCEQQMKILNDGDKSHDFYSLRSRTRNTRQVRKSEKPDMLDIRGTQDDEATQAAHRSSGLRDTSPDKTADVNGEREKISEEEHPGVTSSPAKRHGDKVELESETHRLSPIKRARRKKTEVKSERDEEQTGNERRHDEAENQDEVDTSGCISSPASAGGDIKEEFAEKDAGRRPSRDQRSVAETRGDRFPCRRRTRLLVKLPTKYEDFILCKTKRTRQTAAGRAEKKDGKRKKR
ncbi:neurofilament heavy polypeptide-like [Thunnus maccoyii]|uniref:neurofilament heavy polypeptide-like n=1 Tax=Thunnus maccoyii TaxID=8240 RepID=UPI001C4AD012|nr:neurofilament heavy polypeptide-like [Thunnus maccoyii]